MVGFRFIPIAPVPVWKVGLQAKGWKEGGALGDASSMEVGNEEGLDQSRGVGRGRGEFKKDLSVKLIGTVDLGKRGID